MTITTESRVVDRPLSEVFDLVSDFTTTARWDPGVRSAVQTSPGAPAVGTRYEVVALFFGAPVPMRYVIDDMIPDQYLALTGTSTSSTARDHIRFSSEGGGTRIEWTLTLTFHGPTRLVAPFMGPVVRRIGKDALDGLASWLERGSK